jgi:hypothetical protein
MKHHFVRYNAKSNDLETVSISSISTKQIGTGFVEVPIDYCCGKIDTTHCLAKSDVLQMNDDGTIHTPPATACTITLELYLNGLMIGVGADIAGILVDRLVLASNYYSEFGHFYFDTTENRIIFVPKICGDWSLVVDFFCER